MRNKSVQIIYLYSNGQCNWLETTSHEAELICSNLSFHLTLGPKFTCQYLFNLFFNCSFIFSMRNRRKKELSQLETTE